MEQGHAARMLSAIPEYDWLVHTGQQWWSVADVASHLGVSDDAVRMWCDRIPGAVLYGTRIGWRIPTSGLIVYLADLIAQRKAQVS